MVREGGQVTAVVEGAALDGKERLYRCRGHGVFSMSWGWQKGFSTA